MRISDCNLHFPRANLLCGSPQSRSMLLSTFRHVNRARTYTLSKTRRRPPPQQSSRRTDRGSAHDRLRVDCCRDCPRLPRHGRAAVHRARLLWPCELPNGDRFCNTFACVGHQLSCIKAIANGSQVLGPAHFRSRSSGREVREDASNEWSQQRSESHCDGNGSNNEQSQPSQRYYRRGWSEAMAMMAMMGHRIAPASPSVMMAPMAVINPPRPSDSSVSRY